MVTKPKWCYEMIKGGGLGNTPNWVYPDFWAVQLTKWVKGVEGWTLKPGVEKP